MPAGLLDLNSLSGEGELERPRASRPLMDDEILPESIRRHHDFLIQPLTVKRDFGTG